MRFPVNFSKFSRLPFLQNTSGRLLLRCLGIHIHLYSEAYLENSRISTLGFFLRKQLTAISC